MKKFLSFMFFLFCLTGGMLFFDNSKAWAAEHLLTFKANEFDIFNVADVKLLNHSVETTVTRAGIYIPDGEAATFRVSLKPGYDTTEYETVDTETQAKLMATGSALGNSSVSATAETPTDYFQWVTNNVIANSEITISGIKRMCFNANVSSADPNVIISENTETVEHGSSYNFTVSAAEGYRLNISNPIAIAKNYLISASQNSDGSYSVTVYDENGAGITSDINISVSATATNITARPYKLEFFGSSGINFKTDIPITGPIYLEPSTTITAYAETTDNTNGIVFDLSSTRSMVIEGTPTHSDNSTIYPLTITTPETTTSSEIKIIARYEGETAKTIIFDDKTIPETNTISPGLAGLDNTTTIDYGEVKNFDVTATEGYELNYVESAFATNNATVVTRPVFSDGALQSYKVAISNLTSTTDDATITLANNMAEPIEYNITFDSANSDLPEGITVDLPKTVTHDENVTFSASEKTGYDISGIKASFDGEITFNNPSATTTTTASWTISNVKNDISVRIKGVEYRNYTVTFQMPNTDPNTMETTPYVPIPTNEAKIIPKTIQYPGESAPTAFPPNLIINSDGYKELKIGGTFSFAVDLQDGYTQSASSLKVFRKDNLTEELIIANGKYGVTQKEPFANIIVIIDGIELNKYTITFNSATLGSDQGGGPIDDSYFGRVNFFEEDGTTPLTLVDNKFTFKHLFNDTLDIVLKPKEGYRLDKMTISDTTDAEDTVTIGSGTIKIIEPTETSCILRIHKVTNDATVTFDNIVYKMYKVVFRKAEIDGNTLNLNEIPEDEAKIVKYNGGNNPINTVGTEVNIRLPFEFTMNLEGPYSNADPQLHAAIAGEDATSIPSSNNQWIKKGTDDSDDPPIIFYTLDLRYEKENAMPLPKNQECIFVIINGLIKNNYSIQALAADTTTSKNLLIDYGYDDKASPPKYNLNDTFKTSNLPSGFEGSTTFPGQPISHGDNFKFRVRTQPDYMIKVGTFDQSNFFLTFPGNIDSPEKTDITYYLYGDNDYTEGITVDELEDGNIVIAADITLRNVTNNLTYESETDPSTGELTINNNAIIISGVEYAKFKVSFAFNDPNDNKKIKIFEVSEIEQQEITPIDAGKTILKGEDFKFNVEFQKGFTRAKDEVKFTIEGEILTRKDGVYLIENITKDTTINISEIKSNIYNIYFGNIVSDNTIEEYKFDGEYYLGFYSLPEDNNKMPEDKIPSNIDENHSWWIGQGKGDELGETYEHGRPEFNFAIKVGPSHDMPKSVEDFSISVNPIQYNFISKERTTIDTDNRLIYVTLTNVELEDTEYATVSVYLNKSKVPLRFESGEGINCDFFRGTASLKDGSSTELDPTKLDPTAIGNSVQTINYGDSFPFAVRPKEGYNIESLEVYVNGIPLGPSPDGTIGSGSEIYKNYNTSAVKEHLNITATINILKYDVTFPSSGQDDKEGDDGISFQFETGGEIVKNQVISYNYNSSIRFKMTLDSKHNQSIPAVKVNGSTLHPVNGVYIINNIKEDKKISVEPSRVNTYSVTLTPRAGITYVDAETDEDITTVSPQLYGSKFKFKVKTSEGYQPLHDKAVLFTSGIIKDDLTLTDGLYTTPEITDSANISIVNLDLVDYTITFASPENGGVTYYNDLGFVLPHTVTVKHGDNFEFNIAIDDAYDESIPGIVGTKTGTNDTVDITKLATGRYMIGNSQEGIVSSVTIKVLNVRLNRFTVSFDKITGIEYQQPNGTPINESQTVSHQQSFSFKVRVLPAYADSQISVMLGSRKILSDADNVTQGRQILSAVDGIYTISSIVENKFITVSGVEETAESILINDINKIPDTLKDLNDVQAVIDATKTYNQLPTEKKSAIENIGKLKALQEQVKNFHQSTNDISIEGTEWYLKLVVNPIESTSDVYDRIYKKLADEFILSLYDIYLWDTLNERKYVLPEGQTAYITVPTPDLNFFEKPVGIHENLEGKLDYLIISINGNKTSFEVSSFSAMGLAANRSMKPGRSSLLDAVDANVNALKDYALFNYQSGNSSGNSTVAVRPNEDADDDNVTGEEIEGNISEKFRSRNNKVTAQGSAIRLLLILMILALIIFFLWILIKNRKKKKEET